MKGNISLIISGKALDFDDISKNIGLKPDKIIKTGQSLPLKRKATEEKWIYKIDFGNVDLAEKTSEFLARVEPHIEYLKIVQESRKVELNFYFSSEMGQFGFELANKQIAEIQKTGLNVNFHILSFGLVE